MYGTVINKDGFKIDFFILNEDKTPQGHELQNGEEVIETDWAVANGMNKPKWDGEKWIDTEPIEIVPVIPPINKIDICLQQLVEAQKLLVDVQMEVLINSL